MKKGMGEVLCIIRQKMMNHGTWKATEMQQMNKMYTTTTEMYWILHQHAGEGHYMTPY